jgi:hypothetical protein
LRDRSKNGIEEEMKCAMKMKKVRDLKDWLGTGTEGGSHDEFGRSETGHLRERERWCLCWERVCSHQSHCCVCVCVLLLLNSIQQEFVCGGVFRERERERERERCTSVCMCVFIVMWGSNNGDFSQPLNSTCVVFCCDFIYYSTTALLFPPLFPIRILLFSFYSFTPNLNEINILGCCQITQ